MNPNSIEVLAIILIIIAIVKIIMMILNPRIWLTLVGKIYAIPTVISIIGFMLSALVLYFIIHSGVSIVEVLAIGLFVALLILTGLANYADELILWLRKKALLMLLKNSGCIQQYGYFF